jgi:hypothetical protein
MKELVFLFSVVFPLRPDFQDIKNVFFFRWHSPLFAYEHILAFSEFYSDTENSKEHESKFAYKTRSTHLWRYDLKSFNWISPQLKDKSAGASAGAVAAIAAAAAVAAAGAARVDSHAVKVDMVNPVVTDTTGAAVGDGARRLIGVCSVHMSCFLNFHLLAHQVSFSCLSSTREHSGCPSLLYTIAFRLQVRVIHALPAHSCGEQIKWTSRLCSFTRPAAAPFSFHMPKGQNDFQNLRFYHGMLCCFTMA